MRVSFTHRLRLAELVAEEWADEDTVVATIAQRVVARARHIDGVPCDAPDSDGALILVDSTRPSRRQRAIGARLARLVSFDLAAVTPTCLGALGFAQRLAANDGHKSSAALAPTEAPRLAGPVIEALAGRDLLLVLLLTWDAIIDLEDLREGLWSDRLLVGALAQIPDLPEDVEHIAVVGWKTLRQAASPISSTALSQMVRALARRDADTWWQSISPLLGLDTPDLQQIHRKLAAWLLDLREPLSASAPDPLRAIIATCCWLATADVTACVTRLTEWLSDEDDHRRLAGGAAARALFYLFGSAPSTPPISTHEALLQLVGPIATHGWTSARAILFAARRWAREQSWIDRLLDRPDGAPAELLHLVDVLTVEDRRRLTDSMEFWDNPLPGDNPDFTPGQIRRLREQIALRIALGSERSLLPLADGQSYGVVVVDTSISRQALRRSLAQVASAAVQEIRKRYSDGSLQLLIFRLGQQAPIAGPTERPTADIIAPQDGGLPPRLLGPLLSRLPVEQVRFVVLISPTPTHDEEDWYEPPWAGRLHIYRDVGKDGLPVGVIPTQRIIRTAGEAVAEYLSTRIPRS